MHAARERAMEQYRHEESLRKAGMRSKEEFGAAKREIGITLMDELNSVMQCTKMNTKGWCVICQKECPYCPYAEDASGNNFILTFNTAGTTCVDHSGLGLQLGALGPHILPFIAWIWERRCMLEDVIFHECTRLHASKAILEDHLGATHHVSAWVLCPSNLGFPMCRRRMLSVCISKKRLQDWIPPDMSFKAVVVAPTSIYFDATPEDIMNHLKAIKKD